MHRRNFLAASVVALAAPAVPPSVGMELVQATPTAHAADQPSRETSEPLLK